MWKNVHIHLKVHLQVGGIAQWQSIRLQIERSPVQLRLPPDKTFGCWKSTTVQYSKPVDKWSKLSDYFFEPLCRDHLENFIFLSLRRRFIWLPQSGLLPQLTIFAVIFSITQQYKDIRSGGSMISPRWGRQLCELFPKTAWNWKNLDLGGGTHPSCPP